MNPAAQAHLPVTAVTHPGMRGKNNEDRYAVTAYQVSGGPTPGDSQQLPVLLAVVADGIGGHRAGEVAAGLAVETICQFMVERGASLGSPPGADTLVQAIQSANQLVYQQAQQNSQWAGMGTTCACAWIEADQLVTASVGDSRIYLIRGGQIRQLTIDHTWVQEAIDQGLLTAQQAAQHPNIHVLRRYLGSRETIEPDIRTRLDETGQKTGKDSRVGINLLPGDRLILCTDGLTDLVKEQEILAAFSGLALKQALDRLVELANQRGGHDNITIVAIHVPQTGQAVSGATAPSRRRIYLVGCLAAVALLIFAALLVIGAVWWSGSDGALPTGTASQAIASQTLPGVIPSAAQLSTPSVTTSPPTPTPTPLALESSAVPPIGTLTPWPTNTTGP